MVTIQGRQIERALIVDDEPEARDAYKYVIEDMGIQPYQVIEELRGGLDPFLSVIQSGDVILCDFHLKKRNYAPCNGDEVMAKCFRAKVPGVLCTSIAEPWVRRDCLRYIPGVLRTASPQPDDVRRALERCLREVDGIFEPERRPWRTLVRIDDIDREHRCIYAVVPSWDVRTKVRIGTNTLPKSIRELIEPGRRFHALVNTGAEKPHELFFDSWEAE